MWRHNRKPDKDVQGLVSREFYFICIFILKYNNLLHFLICAYHRTHFSPLCVIGQRHPFDSGK